jgi:hypothetical protein
MALCRIPFRHLHEFGAIKTKEKRRLTDFVIRSRFESDTSLIQVTIDTAVGTCYVATTDHAT